MARGRRHPRYCRLCGARAADGVHISARGKCPACGVARELENRHALRAMSGPPVEHWRRRTAAAVGAVLVTDLEL